MADDSPGARQRSNFVASGAAKSPRSRGAVGRQPLDQRAAVVEQLADRRLHVARRMASKRGRPEKSSRGLSDGVVAVIKGSVVQGGRALGGANWRPDGLAPLFYKVAIGVPGGVPDQGMRTIRPKNRVRKPSTVSVQPVPPEDHQAQVGIDGAQTGAHGVR
jgi:hypothetical protein